jgi:hypothetical protein
VTSQQFKNYTAAFAEFLAAPPSRQKLQRQKSLKSLKMFLENVNKSKLEALFAMSAVVQVHLTY